MTRWTQLLAQSRRYSRVAIAVVALAALAVVAAGCGGDDDSTTGGAAEGGKKKFKIALIQSYSGNDWQNASANLVKALAGTAPFKDEVEFAHHIAGTDPQKQSKLIADEISSGADALVLYPISPTAINAAVRKACQQDVIVVNYDSWTEEPCSYNVHVNVQKLAAARADWLAKYLKGNGKVAEIIGVAGTAFDTIHQKGVDEALKKYPGIKLVAREEGQWAQPGARDAIQKIIAAHPDLDGFIAQVGCWGATQKLQALGKKILPCAGDVAMGHLRMMLPKSQGGIELPSVAGSETTFTGALAFLQAYNILKGGDAAKKERCHETIIDPIVYENKDLKVGEDPKRIGNVYSEEHVPSVPPGFFANFYSPLVGQGLNASLSGTSDPIEDRRPPEPVAGDDKVDGVADQQGNCLVP